MHQESGLAAALSGSVIPSEMHPGVSYRVKDGLGEGGMGVALYAVRESREGTTPAVIKVVRPEIVASAGPTALLMIQKEAIALGRLNERVPPTPFVVRFLDTGSLVHPTMRGVVLPWIAVEYVHGGVEGTTLEERVAYAVRHTRYGFDPARAAHTVECLAEGLATIHEVGVVHRDLTPGNVLCCGFGAGEVPKIADFGIARPSGINVTFGSVFLGTPGYAAPEQSFSSEGDVGPWTDVFSFGCLTYYLLTGHQYIATLNFAQALLMARETKRKSVLESGALSPELRDNPAACRTIDAAIARATNLTPSERTPDARLFAAAVLPTLRATAGPRSQRASERLVQSVASAAAAEALAGFTWTVRHPPGDDRLLRSIAWDGDGHCLAVTTEGLAYWNGTAWLPAHAEGIDPAVGFRSVGLLRPGHWLLGGDNGLLAILGGEGPPRVLHGPPGADFTLSSGDPDDLALLVSEPAAGPPELHSVAAGRFFRPSVLEAARTIAAISRLDETRWLLAGRTVQGSGFAALYSATDFATTFLVAPPTDALTTCAGQVDRGFGIAAGRRGVTVRFDGTRTDSATVEGAPDLACAAFDVQGRTWVGAAGKLWSRSADAQARWLRVWEDPSWQSPFVSLYADVGVVSAVTVDGAVLEGRASRQA